MTIYFKGCYTILGDVYHELKKSKFQFKVPLKDKPSVVVNVIPEDKGGSIESFYEADISEGLWKALQAGISEPDKLPKSLSDEISQINSDISIATNKVLSLIKYCLNNIYLEEQLFSKKGLYWSTDKSEWKDLHTMISVSVTTQNLIYLDNKNVKSIQEYLQNDFQPFLALRHLHRAQKELIPRYKWIEATIALELAIKEFFIRFKPDLEALLLEMPSPPLNKLYGSILKHYAGEDSPKKKEIQKGIEVRNKLLHRPEDTHISFEQVYMYVRDAEIAIYHLLTLLYPEDSILQCFYKRGLV